MSVYDEIRVERARQDARWGGAEHDDRHQPSDWLEIIDTYLTYAMHDDQDYRERLLQAVAVGIAAIEAFDRQVARRAGAV